MAEKGVRIEVEGPVAIMTVFGFSHAASAPSKAPLPCTVLRIGMPSAASLAATKRSSPARTVDAGRPTIAPSGVMNIRSATKIVFGGGTSAGST